MSRLTINNPRVPVICIKRKTNLIKICQYCKKEFTPKKGHKNQQFCCKSCSVKARSKEDIGLFFRENVDDCIKKYILGLIVTDGCIRKDTICISLKDEYMVSQIKELVSPSRKYYRDGNNFQVIWRNKSDVSYLQSIGIGTQKTRTVPFHENIDNVWHYMRGVFDGDGCAFIQTTIDKKCNRKYNYLYISIVSGSSFFVNGLCNFFAHNNIFFTLTKDNRHNNVFCVRLSRRDSVRKFCKNIYKDAGVWKLKRKYQIIKESL